MVLLIIVALIAGALHQKQEVLNEPFGRCRVAGTRKSSSNVQTTEDKALVKQETPNNTASYYGIVTKMVTVRATVLLTTMITNDYYSGNCKSSF